MSKLANPIAMYVYDDKKYFITCSDNRIDCFKYYEGKVSNDYNKEEYTLFLKVLNSIRVNKKKSINLGIREDHGKSFETFYDLDKKLYYWNEVIDGKRCEPSKNDWQILNVKYNHVPTTLEELNDENSSQDAEIDEKIQTFKRRVIHAGKSITVVLTAAISVIGIAEATLGKEVGEKIRSQLSTEEIQETNKSMSDYERYQPYDFQMIEDAVNKNKYLGDKEKEFILKFKEYFEENHDYMDVETVVKRLKTIKVKYHDGPSENPTTSASFTPSKNEINVFNTSSFEECDLQVLLHEFFHVTQVNNSNSLTLELTNQAATEEYLRNADEDGLFPDNELKNTYDVPYYSGGYQNVMWSYYLVANLMDIEARKEFQCSCDNNIIIEELMELNPSWNDEEREEVKVKGIELIETIDSFREKDEKTGFENIVLTQEKTEKLYEQLDYFYTIAYGKNVEDCITENIMQYNNTYNALDRSNNVVCAMSDVLYQKADERYNNIIHQGGDLLGDARFVLPKSYFSSRHENPILYMNVMLKQSNSSYEGVFVDTEITPDVEKSIQKHVQDRVELQKRLAEQTEEDNKRLFEIDSINPEEVEKIICKVQHDIPRKEYEAMLDENGELKNSSMRAVGTSYIPQMKDINSYYEGETLYYEYQGEKITVDEAEARGWVDIYKNVQENFEYMPGTNLVDTINLCNTSKMAHIIINFKDGGRRSD